VSKETYLVLLSGIRRDEVESWSYQLDLVSVKRDLVSVKRDLPSTTITKQNHHYYYWHTLFVRRDRKGMAQCSTREAYTGKKGPLHEELMKTNAPYPPSVTCSSSPPPPPSPLFPSSCSSASNPANPSKRKAMPETNSKKSQWPGILTV
jgi:hypothetical protein